MDNPNRLIGDLLMDGLNIGIHAKSRNTAKDLLEGDSDPKESLIMLGKFQEASKYMAGSKKKEKLNSIEEVDVEEMGSKRFRCTNCENRLQAQQLSVDGSSRNCIKELKKVVRIGLSRQNLLSVPSDEDRASLDQRQIDWLSNGLPASASRSPTIRPLTDDQNSRTDGSVPAAVQQQRAKRPNLIAKLMGLEEIPIESLQNSEKQKVVKTSLHQHLPVFEIDILKARKLQFIASDSKQRALAEIIETMQFKGLLKSDHVRNQPHKSNIHGRNFHMEGFADELPPIVIIKPLHVLHCVGETQTENLSQEDGFSDPIQMLERMGAQESKHMKAVVLSKEGVSYAKRIPKRLGANELKCTRTKVLEMGLSEPKQGVKRLGAKDLKSTETRGVHLEEVPDSPQTVKRASAEELNIMKNAGQKGITDPKQMHKKLRAKKQMTTETEVWKESGSVQKQLIKKPGVKELKIKETSIHERKSDVKLVKRSGGKELMIMKTTYCSSDKAKIPSSLNYTHQKHEANKAGKKDGSVRKVLLEMETKSRSISGNRMIPFKNLNFLQRNAPPNHDSMHMTQPVLHNSMICAAESHKKNAKAARECAQLRSIIENTQHKKNDEETHLPNEMQCISTITRTLPAEQLPSWTGQDSDVQIKERSRNGYQVITKTNQLRSTSESPEVDNLISNNKSTTNGPMEAEIKLKQLLLSSPLFLSCVEELFHLKVNYTNMNSQASDDEVGMGNARFILDCANELVTRKGLQIGCKGHPLLQAHMWGLRIIMSFDQLVEELNDELGYLRCYSKNGGDFLPKDGLYMMLIKDLKGKGALMSGPWDLGWMNGFSMHETDQIVGEVVNHVLDVLMEEVVIDF